jgi:hypothetical protein
MARAFDPLLGLDIGANKRAAVSNGQSAAAGTLRQT